MSIQTPDLPTQREWRSLGVYVDAEMHAGKQSRVFDGGIGGQRAAVKLTDVRLASRADLAERMRVVEALSGDVAEVVAPVRLVGELVQPIGDWLITATQFVTGRKLDNADRNDVELMGGSLARLHDTLARLPHSSVPPVAPLCTDLSDSAVDGTIDIDRSGWQLLHGDFSNQNLMMSSTGLCIFDFDDCGVGPPAYDIANSLYMVLFDADVHGEPSLYEAFRPAFLAGYDNAARSPVDATAVDSMIDLRVRALDCWLRDLSTAPIGIRTSTSAWQDVLRAFVARYRSGRSAPFD